MAAKCCHEPALFPSEAPSGTHEAKKLPRLTAREHATAKCCHGSPPGNASRRYLAKTGSPGTHRGDILPLSDAGGDAFREHFATGERPGTHRGDILASPRCSGIRSVDMLPRPGAAGEGRSGAQRYLYGGVGPNRWKSTTLKSAALSTRGSGLESLACVWASARNTFYASMRLCVYASMRLCVYASMRPFACASVRLCKEGGDSPSRSLITGNGFEVCAVSVGNHEPASRSAELCRIMC